MFHTLETDSRESKHHVRTFQTTVHYLLIHHLYENLNLGNKISFWNETKKQTSQSRFYGCISGNPIRWEIVVVYDSLYGYI